MNKLTVVCVNTGNYLGRGQEYVQKMGRMLDRNLSAPHQRVCITDDSEIEGWRIVDSDPSLDGWWQKIVCFQPGRFQGRVVFLDLDCAIVGALDELVDTKGIIDLADWGWATHTLGSGVMVFDAGEHADIFEKYTADVPSRFRGDQDWITHLGGWQALPAHLCRSYRYHSVKAPPERCVHVSFHGAPKPSDLPPSHWVHSFWN